MINLAILAMRSFNVYTEYFVCLEKVYFRNHFQYIYEEKPQENS